MGSTSETASSFRIRAAIIYPSLDPTVATAFLAVGCPFYWVRIESSVFPLSRGRVMLVVCASTLYVSDSLSAARLFSNVVMGVPISKHGCF